MIAPIVRSDLEPYGTAKLGQQRLSRPLAAGTRALARDPA